MNGYELLETQTVQCTLVEAASILGLSRARVFQLEKRALKKLRQAIEEEALREGISVGEWLSDSYLS